MPGRNNIMIIAGEVSGDIIGAGLVTELRKRESAIRIWGIGGDRMRMAGMELNFHIRDMAFLGFTEVVKHLPYIRKVRRQLIQTIKERKVSLVVLIDYPGFNLNIARLIEAAGIKIIYYVSPQVWAWGSGRVKKIKKYIDKMIVLFKFEEEFYRKHKIEVEFVGHPLLDYADNYDMMTKESFYKKFSLDGSKSLLLLMPGSRNHEIARLLPEMMKAAEKICSEFNLQAIVASTSNVADDVYRDIYPGDYKIIKDHTYELMRYSTAGIIKSGTSTLEAAYFELPMVIVYKTSGLTYFIGKKLIKVKNIGMANIISGEKIVPELIQEQMNCPNIYKEIKEILSDSKKVSFIKNKLRNVKTKLGEKGASERAARIILNELQKN